MRIHIYFIVGCMLLAGCVPVGMLATEATQAPSPAFPTAEATEPLAEPVATLPQPTDEPAVPGSQEAVEAAMRFLAAQLGLDLNAIQVLQVTAVEWSDSCLGIPASGEMCAEVITPGFIIELAVAPEEVLEYFTFHTDTSGKSLRLLPTALVKARQALAELTGSTIEQIILVRFEAVEWRNSCLGVSTPGVNCLDVIVPGYLIILQANGIQYEYHTNQDGSRVILASGLGE